MRINKLLSAVKDGILINERFETEIDALFFDSREKVENGLYFCLTGGKVDGHFYAE
jgi:UDP-N-acetylmuramyl pentapeptide synthase